MNKNLLKRIASVATELDQFGFTREAKSLDLILLKFAQEEYENVYQGYFDNKDFGKKEKGDKEKEVPIEVDDEILEALGISMDEYNKERKPRIKRYFNIYQAEHLLDNQTLLLSARDRDEAKRIVEQYTGSGVKWFFKQLRMMAPQVAAPGVLFDSYDDAD